MMKRLKTMKVKALFVAIFALVALPLVASAATLTFAGGNSTTNPPDGATKLYDTETGTGAERNWTFTLGDANGVVDRFGDFNPNVFRVRTDAPTVAQDTAMLSITFGAGQYVDSVSFDMTGMTYQPGSDRIDSVTVTASNQGSPVNVNLVASLGAPTITGNGTASASATATAADDAVNIGFAGAVDTIVLTYSNADPDTASVPGTNEYNITNIDFVATDATAVTLNSVNTLAHNTSLTAVVLALLLALITVTGIAFTKQRPN